MTRTVAIVLAVLLASPGFACIITVTRPVQVMARSAVIIAEAEALDAQHRFEVTKVWKGAPARQITLRGDVEPSSSCYGGPPLAGETYVLFINCNEIVQTEGFAQYKCTDVAEAVPATPEVLRYLRESKPLSRRELVAKLHDWKNGRISTEEMKAWVAEQKAIADVDDWSKGDEGEEQSFSLMTLRSLNDVFQGQVNGDAECVARAVRETLIEDVIDLLTAPRVSPERLEAIDEAFFAIEDDCS